MFFAEPQYSTHIPDAYERKPKKVKIYGLCSRARVDNFIAFTMEDDVIPKYPEVEITVTSRLGWTICCKEFIDPYNGQSRFTGNLVNNETATFKVSNSMRPCGGSLSSIRSAIIKYPVYYQFKYYDSPYGFNIEMIEENNRKSFELYPDPLATKVRYPTILCREITT